VSSEEIYLNILSKPNCSFQVTAVGFIQNLHKEAALLFTLIKEIKEPRKSQRALILKQNMLYLLENYDNLNRGIPNARRK
tara:strand:+ start:142 stop:381 length:240 start_codon:yes stop_codon:yes gene_type:complete